LGLLVCFVSLTISFLTVASWVLLYRLLLIQFS
jgi:hypothetical protein